MMNNKDNNQFIKDCLLGFFSVFQGFLFKPAKKQKIVSVQYFEKVEQDINNVFEKLKIEYERS